MKKHSYDEFKRELKQYADFVYSRRHTASKFELEMCLSIYWHWY